MALKETVNNIYITNVWLLYQFYFGNYIELRNITFYSFLYTSVSFGHQEIKHFNNEP